MSKWNDSNYPLVTPQGTDRVLIRQHPSGEVKSALVAALDDAINPTITVSTITDLKAIEVSGLEDGAVAIVTGYYSDGDGGGGNFYFAEGSASPDNGGTTIAPDAGTGRWKRLYTGPIYSKWFGAVGDGVTDDFVALQNLIFTAAGSRAIITPGYYRTSDTLEILNSGAELEGFGLDQTVIIADLSVSPILKIGDTASVTFPQGIKLRSFKLTRATGTLPVDSVGLLWDLFNYGYEENVLTDRSAVNRHLYGGPPSSASVGLVIINPLSSNASKYHMKVENIASLYVNSGSLGRNGGDAFDCDAMICITGQANGLVFENFDIIPQGPGVAKPVVVDFVDYINTAGYINFVTCNTENSSVAFRSDSGTPIIGAMNIIGGRWSAEDAMFELDPATATPSWRISAVPISAPVSVTNPKWWTISGCTFGTTVEFIGGADAIAVITGNNFLATLSLTDAWLDLALSGNVVVGAVTNTATGIVDLSFGPIRSASSGDQVLIQDVTGTKNRAVIGASVTLDSDFNGTTTLSVDAVPFVACNANDGVVLGAFAKLKEYTVVTLPSAATVGRFAIATDLNATTRGTTATAGGALKWPVFSDGSNWIVL